MAQPFINGLRNILGWRNYQSPRPEIIITDPDEPLYYEGEEGPYTIRGHVNRNGTSICKNEVHWFCYRGQQGGIVSSEGEFAIEVQLSSGDNLFTFTVVDDNGNVVSNGVVIYIPYEQD